LVYPHIILSALKSAMAHVEKHGDGYRVRFIDQEGNRQTIPAKGLNKTQSQKMALHIDELVVAKTSGITMDPQTAVWLSKISQALHDRLSGLGLVEVRDSSTLAEFLSSYIKRRTDVKPGTHLNYDRVVKNMTDFFGAEKPLRAITVNDALAFRDWLKNEEDLSENTLRRRCGRARQFMTAAKKARMIIENPFDGMTVTVGGNKEKERFVTPQEAQKILVACPDPEWRLIFSLCRHGGLRCPSEVLLLRWQDVHFDERRIVITSPKTAHHKGHEQRVIPLFPELALALNDAKTGTATAESFVVTRYRCPNQNLRTQFNRIIKKAGLTPWPKPFQNLRSTRETELMEHYPAHVVCAWIGNSEAVARKHDLQVTDAHFERASLPP
jgi:integrase